MNHFIKWNIKLIAGTYTISIAIFIIFYITLILLDYISFKDFTSYHYAVYAFWLAPFSATYILLASYLLSIKLSNIALFFNKVAAYLLLIIFLFIIIILLEIEVHYFHILTLLFLSFCIIIVVELLLLRSIAAKKDINLNFKKVMSQ